MENFAILPWVIALFCSASICGLHLKLKQMNERTNEEEKNVHSLFVLNRWKVQSNTSEQFHSFICLSDCNCIKRNMSRKLLDFFTLSGELISLLGHKYFVVISRNVCYYDRECLLSVWIGRSTCVWLYCAIHTHTHTHQHVHTLVGNSAHSRAKNNKRKENMIIRI